MVLGRRLSCADTSVSNNNCAQPLARTAIPVRFALAKAFLRLDTANGAGLLHRVGCFVVPSRLFLIATLAQPLARITIPIRSALAMDLTLAQMAHLGVLGSRVLS
jgi:hypothetical protein